MNCEQLSKSLNKKIGRINWRLNHGSITREQQQRMLRVLRIWATPKYANLRRV